jgi:hypothetical protein
MKLDPSRRYHRTAEQDIASFASVLDLPVSGDDDDDDDEDDLESFEDPLYALSHPPPPPSIITHHHSRACYKNEHVFMCYVRHGLLPS